MTRLQLIRSLVLCVLAASLIACSTVKNVVGTKEVDYRSTEVGRPLEVPPDLTTSSMDENYAVPDVDTVGTATYSAYSSDRKRPFAAGDTVLFEPDTVRMERAGTQRWLVMQGTPQQIWPRIRAFWLKNGFLIARENPLIGVMETDWAENRESLTGGSIQKYLYKWLGGLYSTGTRDKFRVRLERGQQLGTTEIYLSHRGMVEKISAESASDIVETMWEPRASDPELEAEMLRKLMVYLGVDEKQAKTVVGSAGTAVTSRAQLRTATEGYKVLELGDGFDRAWRRVGLSLDRVGFTVEDRDRSQGIYFVRYIEPDEIAKKKGVFSKLFKKKKRSGDEFQYQVKLEGGAQGTEVTVRNKAGAPEKSPTGDRILGLLYEQLK